MATIDVKKDEEGLLTAAEELGLELRFYGSDRLETVSPPNPNPVVKQAVGTEGVAESAALLASDRGGLLREKTVLRPREMAMTLALAKRNERAEKGRNHHESN